MRSSRTRNNLVMTALGLAACVLAGCAPMSRLHLHQPALGGRQRDVPLSSRQVIWAPEDDTGRLLAELPLPGATTGRATYLLYLRWPLGAESCRIANQPGAEACGFFIQTRGEYAGLAELTRGRVAVTGDSAAADAPRAVEVDLRCEDGTRLIGTLQARRDDYALHRFEKHRRAGDVQALLRRTAEPGPIDAAGP